MCGQPVLEHVVVGLLIKNVLVLEGKSRDVMFT